MIKVICIGKIKEKYLVDLINDYKSRIEKYTKFEIIELKEGKNLKEESDNILSRINTKDYVIACDINGKMLDSVSLANTIDNAFISYSNIVFIIGSSEGLDNSVLEKANLRLSFSKFTMPHGLFRGVLLEQIYRSLKINNNETYHK